MYISLPNFLSACYSIFWKYKWSVLYAISRTCPKAKNLCHYNHFELTQDHSSTELRIHHIYFSVNHKIPVEMGKGKNSFNFISKGRSHSRELSTNVVKIDQSICGTSQTWHPIAPHALVNCHLNILCHQCPVFIVQWKEELGNTNNSPK